MFGVVGDPSFQHWPSPFEHGDRNSIRVGEDLAIVELVQDEGIGFWRLRHILTML